MYRRNPVADNFVLCPLRWAATLGCALLAIMAGCQSDTPEMSPTGHFNDTTQQPVTVSNTWVGVVGNATQDAVKKKLEYTDTAVFTDSPQITAFYDQRQNVTRLQFYGTVQTSTPYGVHIQHKYTVGWKRTGKVDPGDFGPWLAAGTTVIEVD